jgi:hypothetical protein
MRAAASCALTDILLEHVLGVGFARVLTDDGQTLVGDAHAAQTINGFLSAGTILKNSSHSFHVWCLL